MYTSLDLKELPVPKAHGLLLSAVAPRPICFASTVDKKGNINLSPFSFFNVFSANPPVMIFSPARRGRDNTTKHTYQNVLEVPEVVINIVNYPIVEQMSLASTEYDKGVNEFIKSGLTQVASDQVTPPRVGEAPVSFECKVNDVVQLGEDGGAGNLVIAEVLRMHIRNEYLDEEGKIDTLKMDFVSRLGGNWYGRVTPESLFEVPKPLTTKGIGVDKLPESVRTSHILSANNLGRLGNILMLPTPEEVHKMVEHDEVQEIIALSENAFERLQILAKRWVEEGRTLDGLKVLMLAEGRK